MLQLLPFPLKTFELLLPLMGKAAQFVARIRPSLRPRLKCLPRVQILLLPHLLIEQ